MSNILILAEHRLRLFILERLTEAMLDEAMVIECGPGQPILMGVDFGSEIPISYPDDIAVKIQELLPDLGRPRRDWEDRQYRRPRRKRR